MKSEMKNTILIVFVSIVVLSTAVSAQDPEMQRMIKPKIEKTRQDRVAMEKAANSSNAAKALHERLSTISAENEFSKAISEVIQAGDRSVVPYLKARLAADYSGKLEIEVALVHLGEKEYFDKTVSELSSKDTSIQYNAIWKLSMFKTKEAYRKLYELLDDETNRDENTHDDSIIATNASVVKDRLSATVENPPKGMDKFNTAAWKAWFAKNKHLLE